ncbi:MAG: DUF2851 family protein [Chitinophagales bacterium]
MTEALLHYVWQHQLFAKSELQTISGKPFSIIHPGFYNQHAGADFFHAKLKFEDVLLNGNVELHIHQADWNKHRHQHDKAYNNTILHVVYEAVPHASETEAGEAVETLELKPLLDRQLLLRYEKLMEEQRQIPCEAHFAEHCGQFSFTHFLERLNVERLEQKVRSIQQLLVQSKHHWDEVAYRLIASYLGGPVNKEPMLQLTALLPLSLLAKYADERFRLEALLFGQAGLLETELEEEFPKRLQQEYRYLKRLHHLDPMNGSVWKFLRMRPASFPTVRIAELAALLHKNAFLFSEIIETAHAEQIHQLLSVTLDDYWKDHARFGQPLARHQIQLGAASRESLVINAVAPLLFAYGKRYNENDKCELAMELLRQTPAENNAITRFYETFGVAITSAQTTQALLQLKQHYCNTRRCLQCDIGRKVLFGKE